MLGSRDDSCNAALTSILKMCKECDASNVSMIRTLILKALSDPEIFCGFDELKLAVQPSLSAASAPDADALLQTLGLFSYGTYKDYQSSSSPEGRRGGGRFVTLTDAQLHKLQMLTVVTLVEGACTESNGILPYSVVAKELSLQEDSTDSLRLVEELMIACLYAGLVRGKLCQKTRSLVCSSQDGPPCRPRDVQQVSSMLQSLRSLQQNLVSTAITMETQKKRVDERREVHQEFLKKIKEANAGKTRSTSTSNALWAAVDSAATTTSRGRGEQVAARAATTSTSSSSSSAAAVRRQGKRSRGGPAGPGGMVGDSYARM